MAQTPDLGLPAVLLAGGRPDDKVAASQGKSVKALAELNGRPIVSYVVEALEGTNESVISHQQNDILYVLTIFSVVILPLTFLTGLFGMNVNFPGFGSTAAFWLILGFFVAVIGGMLGFFRWKRWL